MDTCPVYVFLYLIKQLLIRKPFLPDTIENNSWNNIPCKDEWYQSATGMSGESVELFFKTNQLDNALSTLFFF